MDGARRSGRPATEATRGHRWVTLYRERVEPKPRVVRDEAPSIK